VLRSPEDLDAHRIAEICSDPEIARWTNVPRPYTLEDAQQWIAYAAIERERGSGLHLVALRPEDGRLVGSAALRLAGAPAHGDIGYWVAPDARGTGVGTRAVGLLVDLAFGALRLPYVEIVISPRNEASRAVARRAGFTQHGSELREFKGTLSEFEVWRRSA
jgi:RimJ/RimL family protein N-acetyltransferase